MMNKFSALRRLLSKIKGSHQKVLIIAVVISALTVMASSGLMAFSAFIISFAALQPSIADVLVPVTAVRFFGIARALLRYVERIISHNTIFLYLSNLRVKIYKGVSHMSGEQLFRLGKTDMLNAMTSDIETIQDVFLRGLLPLFSSLLLYVVVCSALAYYDVKVAIIFAALYPIATVGMAVFARRLTEGKSKTQIKELGDYKIKLIAFTDELFELNWNRRTSEYESKLEKSAIQLEKSTERISFGKIVASQVQQIIINLNVLGVLIMGIFLVMTDEISGIYLAVITLVVFTFYESAPSFLTLFQKLEAGDYSANRLLVPISNQADELIIPTLKDTNTPTINYRDLNFQYVGSNVQLKNIDIQLKPKMKMAIVGSSGSGKSTVSALLCGLLAPHEGQIDIDGRTIALGETEVLMSYFSVVNQDVYLFHQRLIDNLRLANSDLSKEAIEKAISFAGLSEWIESGWLETNPWIGEDGMSLSGGQRQRLGLARALLRETPYLILDEAFAGLDIETETEILNRLLTIENRGLIWITHRLVQMEKMDIIMVMAHGEIIATGTHDYLVRNCDAYRELTQNSNA